MILCVFTEVVSTIVTCMRCYANLNHRLDLAKSAHIDWPIEWVSCLINLSSTHVKMKEIPARASLIQGISMSPRISFLFSQKLIRMNMPLDGSGCVHFNTTLFALIRESLNIKMGPASVMDIKDAELRDTVREMWPLQAKRMLNLLVPSDEGETCTIDNLK